MHVSRVRVRFGETDPMGVVYHPNYLLYFELGRTELIRSLGTPYRELDASGFHLVVVEAGLRYRAPARYDDVLRIETRLTDCSRIRARFDYVVRRASDDAQGGDAPGGADAGDRDAGAPVLVTGHTVLASVGDDGRPRRLPEEFLEALRACREA